MLAEVNTPNRHYRQLYSTPWQLSNDRLADLRHQIAVAPRSAATKRLVREAEMLSRASLGSLEYWRAADWPDPLWVYFVAGRGSDDGPAGPVKIGSARDPFARVTELQCGCPWKLIVWELVLGSVKLEKYFHQYYGERRLMGEWFRLEDPRLVLDPGISLSCKVEGVNSANFSPADRQCASHRHVTRLHSARWWDVARRVRWQLTNAIRARGSAGSLRLCMALRAELGSLGRSCRPQAGRRAS